MREFGKVSTTNDIKILEVNRIDLKVSNFHSILRSNLDIFFPQKTVKVSTLDKKWINPGLKTLHRQVQREFFKHRQSKTWKKTKV